MFLMKGLPKGGLFWCHRMNVERKADYLINIRISQLQRDPEKSFFSTREALPVQQSMPYTASQQSAINQQ
ncbi:MAG: hypothetical protein CVU06_13755 [Bacteroidetes bacterium HGW-Bacteroidetes-22]|nr:MAG: hypothetical protein CVU06_13755 [Bacteroidetes bacterium HGW-Bacteroidetes-22]